LLGVAGWKGSGKTTLIERLLPLLRGSGLRVAAIKHTHHPLRDHDGLTDGERHTRAGAAAVIVIGSENWELSGKPQTSPPPSLDDAAALLGDVDLVLVEGFKSAPIEKIEVRGGGSNPPLAASDPLVIAIAADDEPIERVPVFDRNDAEGLAAFILDRLSHLRQSSRPQTGNGQARRPRDLKRRRT
jgi:molybdopterin-guanine dinucleotide biosynthesis protein B